MLLHPITFMFVPEISFLRPWPADTRLPLCLSLLSYNLSTFKFCCQPVTRRSSTYANTKLLPFVLRQPKLLLYTAPSLFDSPLVTPATAGFLRPLPLASSDLHHCWLTFLHTTHFLTSSFFSFWRIIIYLYLFVFITFSWIITDLLRLWLYYIWASNLVWGF